MARLDGVMTMSTRTNISFYNAELLMARPSSVYRLERGSNIDGDRNIKMVVRPVLVIMGNKENVTLKVIIGFYRSRYKYSNGAKVKGIKSNSELLELPPLKMDFPEFYKELEAEFFGESEKLMELQILKLELRLGRILLGVLGPSSQRKFYGSFGHHVY
nr:hypothetical protein [Tanacetum cinerariifolium]